MAQSLPFNTLTIFNATLSFRFGWEGKLRTIEAEVKASLENPQIMGASISEVAEKIAADPDIRREFIAVYGSGPDAGNIVDAIASFERTLVTPDSRFDRWLDRRCSGVVGRGGWTDIGCSNPWGASPVTKASMSAAIFSSDMEYSIRWRRRSRKFCACQVCEMLRPLPPYFHDGSAQTLDDAVRKMGLAQLNSTLTDQQVKAIVAYLQTLTGKYQRHARRGVAMRMTPVAVIVIAPSPALTWLLLSGLNPKFRSHYDRELRALDDFSRTERGFNREVLTARVGLVAKL